MFKTAFKLIIRDIKENADKIFIVFFVFSILDLVFGEVCFARLMFGLPCPFCGLTRAGLSLITLDFKTALCMNPLIFYIAALLILWFLSRYFGFISKRIINILLIVLIVIAIPLYTYRLISYFPYIEPMTYNDNNLFKVVINLIQKFTGG